MPPRFPARDSTRTVLLGLLARYGPKHGYELRALIEQQHIDLIADVHHGAIYSGLKRLARDGLIREVSRGRQGNRPERVAFDITEPGGKELRRLLTDALADPDQPERPIDLAVHFSGLLDCVEVADVLRSRVRALEDNARAVDQLETSTTHEHAGVRAIIEDLSAHYRAVNGVEQRWTASVLRRVEAGGYPTPGRTLND